MYVVLVPLFLLTGATCDDARRHLAIATVAAGAARRPLPRLRPRLRPRRAAEAGAGKLTELIANTSSYKTILLLFIAHDRSVQYFSQ